MEKLICVVLVSEQNFNNLEDSNTFISDLEINTPILRVALYRQSHPDTSGLTPA